MHGECAYQQYVRAENGQKQSRVRSVERRAVLACFEQKRAQATDGIAEPEDNDNHEGFRGEYPAGVHAFGLGDRDAFRGEVCREGAHGKDDGYRQPEGRVDEGRARGGTCHIAGVDVVADEADGPTHDVWLRSGRHEERVWLVGGRHHGQYGESHHGNQ